MKKHAADLYRSLRARLNRPRGHRRLVDRVFRLETVSGDGICPVYLYRWTLVHLGRLGRVYLHKFVGNDWSLDAHDHPKRFTSIGLRGRYVEHVFRPDLWTGRWSSRVFTAPWFRTFRLTHAHRITMTPGETCWTLCIVGPVRREWGFFHPHEWIPWHRYVWGPGRDRKDC